MTKIKENTYYFVAFITATIALSVSLLSLPLILLDYGSISFGVFIGGLIGTIGFILLGYVTNIKQEKPSLWPVIIIIIAKVVILFTVTIIVAFLYYKKDIHLIHPVAVLGSYLISTLVLVILSLRKKGEE